MLAIGSVPTLNEARVSNPKRRYSYRKAGRELSLVPGDGMPYHRFLCPSYFYVHEVELKGGVT